MIHDIADMKMMDMIQRIEGKVRLGGKAIKIEGGLVDLKRFRDLVYLKGTLKHTFLPPSKKRGYWTLIIYPSTPEEFEETKLTYIDWGKWILITLLMVGGVVWHNTW